MYIYVCTHIHKCVYVYEWKNALLEEITVAKGEGTGSKGSKKCDINNDGTCSLKDFSVLMFYVER